MWVQDLLENCSSKPLLVLALLVMNSSHMLLDVLLMLVPSISERLKEPSRRAELLLPSYTWQEQETRRGKCVSFVISGAKPSTKSSFGAGEIIQSKSLT